MKPFYSLALLPIALLAFRPQADVEPLTREMKSQTIEALGKAMDERYVFADIGKKVAADLKSRLEKGEYNSLEKGAEFASALSRDMNLLCKDAHLNVRFSKDPLPKRQDQRQPTAEEIENQRRQMKAMNGGIISAERLMGNVGYIDTVGFMSPEFAKRSISSAMEFLKDTDAIIIDMRKNGGGSPETVQYFCSYFFPAEKPVHLNSLYFRESDETTEFWTLKDLPGERYVDKEVYVLCSKRTGSAAEEFCYNLQNLKRSTLIGESTWGGANPGGVVRLNDHFDVFVPTGRAINPYTKTNWEGTGVKPDIAAAPEEAMKIAHTMALKKLAEKATHPQEKARFTEALSLVEAGRHK